MYVVLNQSSIYFHLLKFHISTLTKILRLKNLNISFLFLNKKKIILFCNRNGTMDNIKYPNKSKGSDHFPFQMLEKGRAFKWIRAWHTFVRRKSVYKLQTQHNH